MRRRSRAGGELVKTRRRKAKALKHGSAPKTVRRRSSSAADQETKVARLTRELNESLERQAATADVLDVVSRSTFNLQAVLDTLVESATRLCDAQDSFIFLPSGDVYCAAARYGFTPEYHEFIGSNPLKIDRGSLVGRTAIEGRVVHVADVLADPNYTRHDAQKIAGYRAALAVPLLREGSVVGVIFLSRTKPQPFTDKQIELVTTFAAQAVIAIENTRLLNELRERTDDLSEALEQQTATSEVLKVISSSPGDLQPVFTIMLENAVRICDAKFGGIYRIEGDTIRLVATHADVPAAYAGARRFASFRPSPKHYFGRMMATRTVLHIVDTAADHGYVERRPEYVAAVELGGVRTFMAVPMLKENEPIGAFLLARQEVRPFTEKQMALVTSFAAQAVIAIENTRLLNELRQRTNELTESLEQQTATSEVLQAISSSPGDLQPVFASMLENAVRICDAKWGTIHRWEGDTVHLMATHNLPSAYANARRRTPYYHPSANSLFGRIAASKSVVHIADSAADKAYRERDPQHMRAVELGGARTVLGVPMLKENELIGALAVARQEVRPFTDKQIELVQNFAAQAVIAIENTRLLNELRESLQQQTATADVLRVISRSTFDPQVVLNTLVESAARLCEADMAAAQSLKDAAYEHTAAYGLTLEQHEHVKTIKFEPGRGTVTGRILLEGNVVHVHDLRDDPEYTLTAVVETLGARTIVGVPLVREGFPIGVFVLMRRSVRPFTEKQIDLLSTFADQAVIAIENTRLLTELRESLQQQTATANVLEVISRSAFDLHAVFETVAESSVRLCGADRAFIFRFDGELLRMAVAFNCSQEFREFVERNPIRPGRHSASARAALERRTIHIPDVRADPEYTYGAKDAEAIRTVLAVPILKGDDLLGVMIIYHLEGVRPFTDNQIAFVETFADQAAIAIENVRLLDALRQRTDELGRSVEEQRALGEVSQAVNSTLDLETVLTTIVGRAVQLSRTDAGAIYVFDDMQREFHLRATYGMDQELIDALTQRRIGMDEPNVERALAQGEPVQIADLREGAPTAVNEIVLRAGFRALLVAPLLRGEDVVGMLVVRRKTPGAFPQNTVDLIKTFAAQSVLAIQNARLFKNVEARTGELAKSLEDLRTAQDRLVQTEKLASLGQLTAGIAHEIKNPLNFVNNFSAVSVELIDELREALGGAHVSGKLREEISEITDTLQGNLEKIVQHGKRADSIVKNMLLHSRQGSGEHRPVDINALVDESLNLAYHGARAEKQGFNITLERSFDPTAGEVDLFPQEITRVLLNLISNGFYAATKRKAEANGGDYEPTLAAATKNLGDSVEIKIRDNGTGIPSEVKEKLFNPFFTTKPAGEGTGLGLSISHDIIVKQHGGSIEVDTRTGEFTEFRIVLPRRAATVAKSGERW
jgi:two-component system NtrC family sensor kinase